MPVEEDPEGLDSEGENPLLDALGELHIELQAIREDTQEIRRHTANVDSLIWVIAIVVVGVALAAGWQRGC